MSKSFQHKYIQAVILLASCSAALSCHGSLLTSGISAEEKRIILQEHNKLRQLVATGGFPGQPAAENMQEIVWDDELAVRAQEWANNCEFRHDPKRTIKRFTMGQNLAVIWSTAPLEADDGDFPSRINNWFNEVQKYSFGASWSPKTGHYSQLVWGETNLIGCGYSEYKDRSKYNKLYVCNYGPGGNVVGYNPYEIGKPSCKNYGMNPSPRYKGLCMDPSLSPFSGASVNNIETYEYKTNKINTKTSYTSTQFNNQQLQQAKPQQQYEQQRKLPQLPTFPAIPALPKPPTTLPALISTLLQYQPLQSQILSQQPDPQQHQPEEGTQSISLPVHRKSIGEQSILRAILNPSFETAREMLREEFQPKLEEMKQEPTQQQEQDQNQEPQQEEQEQNQVPIDEHKNENEHEHEDEHGNKNENENENENEHENENENEHKHEHDQEPEHQQEQEQIKMQEQQQQTDDEILEPTSSESTVQPTPKGGWSFLTWRG